MHYRPLASRQRRRAVVEVTFNGLSAAWRHRFELHYRRSQDPRVFGASHRADRQLPSERRRSHLVSHLTPDPVVEIENVKVFLTWSPVTESNRRPFPYHASRFRLMASHRVGLPQARWISVSGYVVLCLPLPGVVVTWFVTGSTSSFRNAGSSAADGSGGEPPARIVSHTAVYGRSARRFLLSPHSRAVRAGRPRAGGQWLDGAISASWSGHFLCPGTRIMRASPWPPPRERGGAGSAAAAAQF